jgi:hypothetical protein
MQQGLWASTGKTCCAQLAKYECMAHAFTKLEKDNKTTRYNMNSKRMGKWQKSQVGQSEELRKHSNAYHKRNKYSTSLYTVPLAVI